MQTYFLIFPSYMNNSILCVIFYILTFSLVKITPYHTYVPFLPPLLILAALHSIIWTYHNLLNLSSVYEHVGCFQYFEFTISFAMNTLYIRILLFLEIYLQSKFLDIGLLGYNVHINIVLLNMTKIFLIILSPKCIPNSNT